MISNLISTLWTRSSVLKALAGRVGWQATTSTTIRWPGTDLVARLIRQWRQWRWPRDTFISS